MKCFGSQTNYIQILCAYGYSMSIFIPVIIACSLPIGVRKILNVIFNFNILSLYSGFYLVMQFLVLLLYY